MGWFKNLRDALTKGGKIKQEVNSTRLSVQGKFSDYENLFAQVRPLVDEMLTVDVYGVGRNGARLPMARTPELATLYEPNESMSRTEFLDAAFTTWLTEPEVSIHVHLDERRRVLGYTILPVGCRQRQANGENIFSANYAGGQEQLTDAEVMTLKFSRAPRDLDRGVSPATASHYWAVIDDLVAQYQTAFFENGAVPATITFITASTRERFEETRRKLESGLKGARNRNKTIYAWRQLLDDGRTGDEIEVKTIQGSNSTLALKDIIEIVTNKLNMNFGASNFIMGDDSSAKYDNAELSDHQFTKRRVYPALVKFWSGFQHELDRIVDGLGYAIDFQIDIPELTDRVRVQTETRRIEAEIKQLHSDTENNKASLLMTLVQAGSDPLAACQATGLITRPWVQVAQSIHDTAEAQAAEPEPVTYSEAAPTCSHTVDADTDFEPVFSNDERQEKNIYDRLVAYARALAMAQVDGGEVDFDAAFDDAMAALIVVADRGALQGTRDMRREFTDKSIKQELTGNISEGVHAVDATVSSLRERLRTILENYRDEVINDAAEVVEAAQADGVTRSELTERLEKVVPKGHADTIARSETHYAELSSEYDTISDICQRYDAEAELEWIAHIDDRTCEVCRNMDGRKIMLGEAWPGRLMLDNGTQINFDHNVYNNNGRLCNAHSRCRCAFAVKVTRQPVRSENDE